MLVGLVGDTVDGCAKSCTIDLGWFFHPSKIMGCLPSGNLLQFAIENCDLVWIYPLNMVDLSIKNWDFPIKNGDCPIKNGDFPIKNGDFPIKNCDFPSFCGCLPGGTTVEPTGFLAGCRFCPGWRLGTGSIGVR